MSTSKPYHIAVGCAHEPDVWFNEMLLEPIAGGIVDLADHKQALEACFTAVMTGGTENDRYNALVLAGGLIWRDVALVRTISRFLRQIRVSYSQEYMWATLVKHVGIATDIVENVPRPLRSAPRHYARRAPGARENEARCD